MNLSVTLVVNLSGLKTSHKKVDFGIVLLFRKALGKRKERLKKKRAKLLEYR
jgi:hypothetical protein